MTTVDVLRKARGYIERGWTQGATARDGAGYSVMPCDADAVSWCASGALSIASGDGGTDYSAAAALSYACDDKHGMTVTQFNDHRAKNKDDVLALFDIAIKREGGCV